jgi:hypothetical protein
VSRCVRRGGGASICAGSLGTGLTGTGGGSPIRAVPCLVICAEAETAMLTTPVVGLSVGIGGGRQVTPDQHHGLSPRRRQIMCKVEPAPFPTESAPHIAANHANSRNARAHPPDRPVSSKSRRPGKAERGVRIIARDPQCWRSLSSMHQRASTKWPQGVANKN